MIFCNYDPETGNLSCERFEIDRKSIQFHGSVQKAVDWMMPQVRACLIGKGKDYDRALSDKGMERLQLRIENLKASQLGRPNIACVECGAIGTVGLGSCEGHPGCSACLWRMPL